MVIAGYFNFVSSEWIFFSFLQKGKFRNFQFCLYEMDLLQFLTKKKVIKKNVYSFQTSRLIFIIFHLWVNWFNSPKPFKHSYRFSQKWNTFIYSLIHVLEAFWIQSSLLESLEALITQWFGDSSPLENIGHTFLFFNS